ncbi:MAG TPA: PQQ-dependent sugar dehydrogenase, partial [Fimbriimonadales bacterium]|nr:PQQ-dependent sugar dehydrogenase [Fimbriimonadales bacterium]
MRIALLLSLIFAITLFLNAQTLTLTSYFFEPHITGLSLPTCITTLSENEMFVCEKETGKVKYFKDGIFVNVVLDLPVENDGESGLLGIELDPNFTTNGRVYVYYSHAPQDGGPFDGNRLEKFIWNGTTLVFEKLLWEVPFDNTQNNGPGHQGGEVHIGPDEKLYLSIGDMTRGGLSNGRIEQNTSTTAVAGAGAIYRLNLDGTIPSDNPFINESDDRLKAIFAYGVRNCFGFTFDSLTGKLWMTDNGPEVYDEVNWFSPGANGGWLKIMGPDARNATYGSNNYTSYDADDLVYLTGSHYQDPVFSWLESLGITGIVFLDSYKFQPAEKNNVLISDFNLAQLYYFKMNDARDGFVLTGGAADGVADSPSERDINRVGTGWGHVSDLHIGKDGYLYVTGILTGTVYRIRPYNDKVLAKTLNLVEGSIKFGGLKQTYESDDVYLNISGRAERGNVIAGQIELKSTAPPATTKTLKELHFILETHVTGTMGEKIELWNYQTQNWEAVSSGTAGANDKVTDAVITSNIERFIQSSDREIRARITWTRIA